MPTCRQCGQKSLADRLFCPHCGARLDLSHADARDLRPRRTPRGRDIVRFALIVLLVSGAAAIVAALRPGGEPSGRIGPADAARNVAQGLAVLHGVDPTVLVGRPFQESEINAYFHYMRRADLGLAAISVRLRPDEVAVRWVAPAGEGPWRKLNLTREVVLRFDDGAMRFDAAAVGRLPMVGPPRDWVFRELYRRFENEREMAVLRRVSGVDIGDRTIVLTVGHPEWREP